MVGHQKNNFLCSLLTDSNTHEYVTVGHVLLHFIQILKKIISAEDTTSIADQNLTVIHRTKKRSCFNTTGWTSSSCTAIRCFLLMASITRLPGEEEHRRSAWPVCHTLLLLFHKLHLIKYGPEALYVFGHSERCLFRKHRRVLYHNVLGCQLCVFYLFCGHGALKKNVE